MAELNHDTIKAKIVAILKANTALFTTTAEANKLRKIEVGFPAGNQLTAEMIPYAFVTNSTGPFETITTGQITSNSIQTLTHTLHYDITIVVDGEDSKASEKKLDDFQETLLNTLETDYNFTGTTTSLVDQSMPVRIDKLRIPTTDEGKSLKGRVITYRVIKRTDQA